MPTTEVVHGGTLASQGAGGPGHDREYDNGGVGGGSPGQARKVMKTKMRAYRDEQGPPIERLRTGLETSPAPQYPTKTMGEGTTTTSNGGGVSPAQGHQEGGEEAQQGEAGGK